MAVRTTASGARAWSAPPPRSVRTRGSHPRLRLLAVSLVVALLAAWVEGHLVYWQLVEHGRLSQWASDQYQKSVPLPATRGVIFDRAGRPLAVNTTVYSIYISPDAVPAAQRDQVAAELAGALGIDGAKLAATLRAGGKFAYVARRQPKTRADQVMMLGLPGVGLQEEQQRSYLPGGSQGASLASNLLGYVDYDGKGQYGVEAYYNQRLAGKAGFKTTYQDAAGRDIALGPSQRVNAVDGQELVLSLDASIQYAAEQALAAGVQANHAESGSVIILDSHTGGIVAWADYPTFNGNSFTTADPGAIRDSIASDLYEPGSIMKVVTLAGALDNHAITPTTTINDPGQISVGGSVLRDWDLANHGTVTMTNVLEKSLNVGAVRAMQMEGPDKFMAELANFGFDRPTGIDVASESTAPLRPLAQWHQNEVATASYGQGIAVNMVQMAAAINVVANGGRYAPPHVVERAGGQPVVPATPQRQVISPDSARQMTQMMESVVQNGSGWTARVQGFEKDEAGKTGTSQMPEAGGYSMDHVWASYAGFLPADNPKFTMLVVVRKPNNGSFDHNEGYYVSAPIWKQIASAIVLQDRLTPEH